MGGFLSSYSIKSIIFDIENTTTISNNSANYGGGVHVQLLGSAF